jgi:hypothetical protein
MPVGWTSIARLKADSAGYREKNNRVENSQLISMHIQQITQLLALNPRFFGKL